MASVRYQPFSSVFQVSVNYWQVDRCLKIQIELTKQKKELPNNSGNNIHLFRAGEPGVFGSLEPEPLEKKTRSRSRLGKKSGNEAAKKLTGSPALHFMP